MTQKLSKDEEHIKNNNHSESSEKKLEEGNVGDNHVEDLGILNESASSSGTAVTTDDGEESPYLTEVPTHNSIPASIMSHPHSGADLEKGPTGLKNNTIDENGKIVVNWLSGTDPENPKNWPRKKKIFNVVVISAMTFLCPLCSAMFVLPPLDEVC
jgi:hypothetical protein